MFLFLSFCFNALTSFLNENRLCLVFNCFRTKFEAIIVKVLVFFRFEEEFADSTGF